MFFSFICLIGLIISYLFVLVFNFGTYFGTNQLWCYGSIFEHAIQSLLHTCLLVSILGAKPNHIPLKYSYTIIISNSIRHIYLLLEASLGDKHVGEQKHHNNGFASFMCGVGFT